MPSGDVCCKDGDGAYCEVSLCFVPLTRGLFQLIYVQAGYYCTATGCCKEGKTCVAGSAGGGGGSGSGSSGGSGGSGGASFKTSSSGGFSFPAPTVAPDPTVAPEDNGGGASQGLPTPTSSIPIVTPPSSGGNNNNNGPGNSGASLLPFSAGCFFAAIAGSLALFL